MALPRSLLVALLVAGVAAAPGCFLDEIDKSMESYESAGPRPRERAEAKSAAAKGAEAAPAEPSAKSLVASWWKTARTLGSEPKNEAIVGCALSGRVEYMLRDDCLARGGEPR